MENQSQNAASKETPSSFEGQSRPALSSGNKKKIIGGITYVRDAFGCYVPATYLTEKIRIRKPEDALMLLTSIRFSPQEIFMVMNLDASHQVIGQKEVTVGLANQSQIHPRETFRSAIADNAIAIMVAHNHPSGNLEASTDDLLATRRLVEAGKVIGIPVLDHLIVSHTGFVSLRERFPDYFR